MFENNSVHYHDKNIDTEIEEMTKKITDLEKDGEQLDSLISESGLFK